MASIFQYGPPCIQDSSQEELGSAILKFNAFQYLNGVLCPSWFCYLHGSSVMCMSAAPKKSRKPMASLPHEPAKIVFGFVWNRTALWQKQCFLVSFLRKMLHCPNKAWGASPQDWARLVFGDSTARWQKSGFFGTVQHDCKKIAKVLYCPVPTQAIFGRLSKRIG